MNVNHGISAAMALPAARMTIWNFCRLDSLLTTHAHKWSWRAAALLAQKLKTAIVMDDDQIPSEVATMQSRIEFRIDHAGLRQTATLVYPGEGHLHDDALPVLSPLGSALLGLSEGHVSSYGGNDGGASALTVLRVLHQPEADRRRRAMVHAGGPFRAPQLETV